MFFHPTKCQVLATAQFCSVIFGNFADRKKNKGKKKEIKKQEISQRRDKDFF